MTHKRREPYRGTQAPGTRRALVRVAWSVPCAVCGAKKYRAACRLGLCKTLPDTHVRNPEGKNGERP